MASDRIVTLDTEDEKSSAVALSLADGKVVWRAPLDASLPDDERGAATATLGVRDTLQSQQPACERLPARDCEPGGAARGRRLRQHLAGRAL